MRTSLLGTAKVFFAGFIVVFAVNAAAQGLTESTASSSQTTVQNIPSMLELAILLKKAEAEKLLAEAQKDIAQSRLETQEIDAQAKILELSDSNIGVEGFDVQSNQQGNPVASQSRPAADGFVDIFGETELEDVVAGPVVEQKPEVDLSGLSVALWNRATTPARAVLSSAKPFVDTITVNGTKTIEPGIELRVTATRITAMYEGEEVIVADAQ